MLVRRPPEVALLAMRAQPRARLQQYALVFDAKRREIQSQCNISTFTWHVGDLPDDARMVPGIMVMHAEGPDRRPQAHQGEQRQGAALPAR